jgi:ABC-type oligopeptide transport system substrate-binding subunit
MDTFLSYSHNNNTHWKNEKFDALVEKAARTADPDASIALYREAEELAVREMSKLPLYFYTKSNLIKPWIKGYWPNASNDHYMRWMWVDSDWCKPGRDNTPAYAPREFPKPGRIAAPPAKTDAGAAP